MDWIRTSAIPTRVDHVIGLQTPELQDVMRRPCGLATTRTWPSPQRHTPHSTCLRLLDTLTAAFHRNDETSTTKRKIPTSARGGAQPEEMTFARRWWSASPSQATRDITLPIQQDRMDDPSTPTIHRQHVATLSIRQGRIENPSTLTTRR